MLSTVIALAVALLVSAFKAVFNHFRRSALAPISTNLRMASDRFGKSSCLRRQSSTIFRKCAVVRSSSLAVCASHLVSSFFSTMTLHPFHIVRT